MEKDMLLEWTGRTQNDHGSKHQQCWQALTGRIRHGMESHKTSAPSEPWYLDQRSPQSK